MREEKTLRSARPESQKAPLLPSCLYASLLAFFRSELCFSFVACAHGTPLRRLGGKVPSHSCLAVYLCVFFTSNRSFYRSTSSTPSVCVVSSSY